MDPESRSPHFDRPGSGEWNVSPESLREDVSDRIRSCTSQTSFVPERESSVHPKILVMSFDIRAKSLSTTSFARGLGVQPKDDSQ